MKTYLFNVEANAHKIENMLVKMENYFYESHDFDTYEKMEQLKEAFNKMMGTQRLKDKPQCIKLEGKTWKILTDAKNAYDMKGMFR